VEAPFSPESCGVENMWETFWGDVFVLCKIVTENLEKFRNCIVHF
jgi:hypothetical protein